MDSIKWFKDAKFGIMVHFGLYSVLEGEYKGKKVNEWVRHSEKIQKEAYHKLMEVFNPYTSRPMNGLKQLRTVVQNTLL